MAVLSLLHTGDMHNRLSVAAARRLGELREQHRALLLDSGDAVGAGNVTFRRSEPILTRMNVAGYTAMAVGNREYFFRKRGLIHKTREAQFAVLGANLHPNHGDLGHIQPWVTVTAPTGERVGILALARTMIRPGHPWAALADTHFVPWQIAAQEAAAALRGQVDWLVALSHLGRADDGRLVALLPEIDVVLGGHDHPATGGIEQVGPTLISRAAPYAKSVTLIMMTRQGDTRQYESSVIELP